MHRGLTDTADIIFFSRLGHRKNSTTSEKISTVIENLTAGSFVRRSKIVIWRSTPRQGTEFSLAAVNKNCRAPVSGLLSDMSRSRAALTPFRRFFATKTQRHKRCFCHEDSKPQKNVLPFHTEFTLIAFTYMKNSLDIGTSISPAMANVMKERRRLNAWAR
jgi:hypothetical protein